MLSYDTVHSRTIDESTAVVAPASRSSYAAAHMSRQSLPSSVITALDEDEAIKGRRHRLESKNNNQLLLKAQALMMTSAVNIAAHSEGP